ncbi:hypothetical protein Pelo_13240 [Pelomyxa schiedti]|nr:hypothetical protein Pelo_13240 [Pelomyxa schiedti]
MRLYEELQALAHSEVRRLAESIHGMKEYEIPLQVPTGTPVRPGQIPVGAFISQDFFINAKKLLLLLKGAGDRTLCWSEAACVRPGGNLNSGAMLSYIKQAINDGYSVLIASPNLQCFPASERSTVYAAHMAALTQTLLVRCPAAFIDIVGYSYGGVIAANMIRGADWFPPEMAARIRRVVFIDSVHKVSDACGFPSAGPEFSRKLGFLQSSCVHFRVSSEPRGQYIADWPETGCMCMSVGTEDHDLAPGCATDCAFEYLSREFSVDPEIMDLLQKFGYD